MSSNPLSINRFAEVLGLKKTTPSSKAKKQGKSKKGMYKGKKLNKTKKNKKQLIKGEKSLTKAKKEKKGKKVLKDKKEKKTKKESRALIIQNPLCDTCIKIKKDKTHPSTLLSMNDEDWRNAKVFIPMLGKGGKSSQQEVNIDLGKKYANRLLYYFAAKPIDAPGIKKYPNVYANSTNNGLVKLDTLGKACVYVDCPSIYCDKVPKHLNKSGVKMTRYINHIHMVVSNKEMTKWEDNMFTQNVFCKINKEDYLRRVRVGVRVIINALDVEYNIPGTDGNILYKEAGIMSAKELRNRVKNIAMMKSCKHKQKVNSNNVHRLPLIVYCHNPKCDAAKKLASALYNSGFNDILYYSGGFLGYYDRL
jgi:hypothetical protein